MINRSLLPKSSVAAADAVLKADSVVNDMGYQNIAVSVSGGSDSDIVVDIISRVDRDKKCRYRYFDTGMEYEATFRHLDYLEERYNIEIERVRAVEKVPLACHRHGLPVFSKHVAQTIGKLQDIGFDWSDEPESVLLERYKEARVVRFIKWWTNGYQTPRGGISKYTVANRRWLKEFIMENPPTFPISDECCLYAKKLTAQREHEESGMEVDIIGVRKAEGGVRANAATTCFSPSNAGHGSHGYAVYRPVWWFTDADKRAYTEEMKIVNSDCYSLYGFTRTGCALCPFAGSGLAAEMDAIRQYEPRLYRIGWKVFGKAYEYQMAYERFKREMDARGSNQLKLF